MTGMPRTKSVRWACIAASALLSTSGVCGERADTRPFRYVRGTCTGEDASELWSLVLDEHIFSNTAPDFGDLRLVASDGEAVPYVLRVKRKRRIVIREVSIFSSVVSFTHEKEANAMVIVVKRGDGEPSVRAIDIETDLTDFERRVDVSASPDGVDWIPLVEQHAIMDYSRFIDVRSTRIGMADSAFQFYRIRIGDTTDDQQLPLRNVVRESLKGATSHAFETVTLNRRDFRVEAIHLLGPEESASETYAEKITYPARHVTSRTNKHDVVITCDGAGVPLANLILRVAGGNFSRPVVVHGVPYGSGMTKQYIGAATVSRIAFGAALREQLSVATPGARRWKELEVTIENGDNPPLDIVGVDLVVEARELVFMRPPAAAQQLFYGADGMAVPRYDVADVIVGMAVPVPGICTMGEPEPNRGRGLWRLSLVSGRALLVVVILVAAVLLLWLLMRALQKIRDLPSQD